MGLLGVRFAGATRMRRQPEQTPGSLKEKEVAALLTNRTAIF